MPVSLERRTDPKRPALEWAPGFHRSASELYSLWSFWLPLHPEVGLSPPWAMMFDYNYCLQWQLALKGQSWGSVRSPTLGQHAIYPFSVYCPSATSTSILPSELTLKSRGLPINTSLLPHLQDQSMKLEVSERPPYLWQSAPGPAAAAWEKSRRGSKPRRRAHLPAGKGWWWATSHCEGWIQGLKGQLSVFSRVLRILFLVIGSIL